MYYWLGLWQYWDSLKGIEFEYVGIQNLEWSKKGNKWEKSSRGEESNLFLQIKRTLEFGRFEYKGGDKYYHYFFKPNVPFLAPERWKEMVGYMDISKQNLLPRIIWAGLPDSSVFWRVEITNFNQNFSIAPPETKVKEYEVLFDTTIKINSMIDMLKRRLNLINAKYKIGKKGKSITLKIPSYYRLEDIKEMLRPGELIVYGVTEDKLEAERALYLQSEPQKPVYITGQIFDSKDVKDCALKFDNMNRPFLVIFLKKDITFPEIIAFEIDSVIYGITRLDFPQTLSKITIYADTTYFQMNLLKGYTGQMLPSIEIKPITKEDN